MKTLRFGIEIETVGAERWDLGHAIQRVVGGRVGVQAGAVVVTANDGREWKVVRDGSLSCDMSGEIVSPILTYADLEPLQRIVREVRAVGARTDHSTGIHIHVDGSRFEAGHVANLVKLVHKQERLLEHALGIDAARLRDYCRPIDANFMTRLLAQRPRTFADLRAAWYGDAHAHASRYDQSRYHGLNLHSLFFRGTLEFRYFNSTLHAGEVKAYVQLTLALAAKALGAKATSAKRREFNPATAKYDFRVVLLSLGLIGEEFKTARLHLTKRLAGSAAWKGERRDRRPAAAPTPAPAPAAPTSDADEPDRAAA